MLEVYWDHRCGSKPYTCRKLKIALLDQSYLRQILLSYGFSTGYGKAIITTILTPSDSEQNKKKKKNEKNI